ncbi:MAG: flagellar M-ring protein FliF [Lachnospiraceae bacterium]|nr:flagellar M-ring protein FliF [Lachnospiraceae bacterium]
MPEAIQNILNRIKEWWSKFSTKQKAILISTVAVVVVAIVILAYVVTRPTWVTLVNCTTAQQASSVKELLTNENIEYQTSQDGMTYMVKTDDQANASILLGTNNIPAEGYSISDVIDGSFSTTEADKEKKYKLYLEEKFAKDLTAISSVDSAEVTLNIPSNDGTISSKKEESYANVILHLKSGQTMEQDTAAGIAQYVATGLGNKTTDNIVILDGDGNVLFSGGDSASGAGTASSNLSAKEKASNSVSKKVKDILLGSQMYDDVKVAPNLSMSFDKVNEVDYNYYLNDGQTQGYLDSRTESTSESTSGTGGVPGTDNNDNDTTYVIDENGVSSSTTSDVTEDYLPSEKITTTDKEVGAVDLENSSISVVAKRFVIYNEDEMKEQGQLDDQTFAEFEAANSDIVRADVDDEMVESISRATGIAQENISMTAYNVPMFQPSAGLGLDLRTIIEIALAVLIFALLAFVVFRTLRKDREEEVEEEITIEDLIQGQEDELEDIGYNEKSEARMLIEKFVDERPDAVATLLRNWLNDDWG